MVVDIMSFTKPTHAHGWLYAAEHVIDMQVTSTISRARVPRATIILRSLGAVLSLDGPECPGLDVPGAFGG